MNGPLNWDHFNLKTLNRVQSHEILITVKQLLYLLFFKFYILYNLNNVPF